MAIAKIDLINDSYSQLRISGLTVQPGPDEVQTALERLEDMAWEWDNRINTGYNFEDDPDANSDSGIPRAYKQAFSTNLAVSLIPDYNTGSNAAPGFGLTALMRRATVALSNMSARAFKPLRVSYPSRQPIGSGNRRFDRLRSYYPGTVNLTGTDNVQQDKDTAQPYVFAWASHLNGEDIKEFSFFEENGRSGIVMDKEAQEGTNTSVEISFDPKTAGRTFQLTARVVSDPSEYSYEIPIVIVTT